MTDAATKRMVELAELKTENARLKEALKDIAGRWEDDSEHSRLHDPDTCEAVICVAKRALSCIDSANGLIARQPDPNALTLERLYEYLKQAQKEIEQLRQA